MKAPETVEKTQAQVEAPEQEKRPGGTMFDPETIRKFLEQIKKNDQ